jgi:hypothetical protein
MDDVAMVLIPVSREAASALDDDARREKIGKLISDILRPVTPEADPVAALIREVKIAARADGLTDAYIDAELSTYNANLENATPLGAARNVGPRVDRS